MTVSNIGANVVLQTSSNPRLLGRTVSLYMLALRGGLSVGALITGATVTALGVQHALLINGVAAVVLQLVIARSWLGHAAGGRSPTSRLRSDSPER